MISPSIYEFSELGIKNSAVDLWFVGAQGGAFLMIQTNNRKKFSHFMPQSVLKMLRFKFDFEGTEVVMYP
jgi:D-glycero-alpha-D-manno-heptose-7-phosphate kinase